MEDLGKGRSSSGYGSTRLYRTAITKWARHVLADNGQSITALNTEVQINPVCNYFRDEPCAKGGCCVCDQCKSCDIGQPYTRKNWLLVKNKGVLASQIWVFINARWILFLTKFFHSRKL